MIRKEKFVNLPEKTKINQIAKVLEAYRNALLNQEEQQNYVAKLKLLSSYLDDSQKELSLKLSRLLAASSQRSKLEQAHFLFHELKAKIGFPVSEKNFIQVKKDNKTSEVLRSELIIILENLRSAFNVGSFCRLSDCFGLKEVIITGLTPGKENQSVKKTAKGTLEHIKLTFTPNLTATIMQLKDDGYEVLGCETAVGSINLYEHNFSTKSILIFGNEELGITEDTLALCDKIVEIPLKGFKNSLNVATAGSAIISEYNRQQEYS